MTADPSPSTASPAAEHRAGRILTITQVRSSNGAKANQRETLRSLGLRRIGHTVERPDSPQLRGMVHAVRHLIQVEQRHA